MQPVLGFSVLTYVHDLSAAQVALEHVNDTYIKACFSRCGSALWVVASRFGTNVSLVAAKHAPLRVRPLHQYHGVCRRTSTHTHGGSDVAPQLCLHSPFISQHIPSCTPAKRAHDFQLVMLTQL